jgi:hypothetical protein
MKERKNERKKERERERKEKENNLRNKSYCCCHLVNKKCYLVQITDLVKVV